MNSVYSFWQKRFEPDIVFKSLLPCPITVKPKNFVRELC